MKYAIVEGLTVTDTGDVRIDHNEGAEVVATVTDPAELNRYIYQGLAVLPVEEA